MSFYWQFQVVTFCSEKNHNQEAPNQQNQRCNLRSIWEVIRDSEDFKTTTPMTTQPPKPTFSLLQITQRIVCLVLDKSGSMTVCAMSLTVFWMLVSHLCTIWSGPQFGTPGIKHNPDRCYNTHVAFRNIHRHFIQQIFSIESHLPN